MNTDGNTYAIDRHLAEREVYDEQQELLQEMQDLRDEVDTLTAKLAEVTAELHMMKTAGVIEVAVRNPSVYEYMTHWEARAEAAEAKLAEVTAERDEHAERIDELQHACEVVSSEFERELWQSCRRLLKKTGFDFHGADVDGIQADDFESHMNETLTTIEKLKEMMKDNSDENK